MENLNLLLNRLLENSLDFVLVGGYAAVVHGASQITHDLDICAVITEEQLAKLRQALSDLEPKHRMNPNFQPSLNEVPVTGQLFDNYYLRTAAGLLDIVKEVSPAGNFQEIKARSVEIRVFGHSCRVISLDDLIKIKSSMNRSKDRFVLDELLEIKRRYSK